jgi:uncharacterized protein (DUF2252 family)
MDVVRRIQAYNSGRDPERLRLKYQKLRSGAFAFLRGTCHLFYERLHRTGVPGPAPLAWACGDLHLENFGSYKSDSRLVHFDINDFDESALAPASWDLLRLLASLWVGAGELGLSPHEAEALGTVLIQAYVAALAAARACGVERDSARGLVRELLDAARERSRAQFLDARTLRKGGMRVLRTNGGKALPANARQRAEVTAFMAGYALTQPDPGFYDVLDVARRIAGIGSLGLDRHVILVRGKGSPDGNYLLDLRPALPSSLLPYLSVHQPPWPTEAHRVVAVQQRMQAVPMAFLDAVLMDGRPYLLRGLQPAEDRLTLDHRRQALGRLEDVVQTLGQLLAWAQLRSAGRQGAAGTDELADFGRCLPWQAELLQASHSCAAQVLEDAAEFATAYDDHALDA